MSFPIIILALAMVAIFGTGLDKVIIAITIPIIPRCARVVRSSALAIREMPYVDAARSIGYSNARIIMRHMVPKVAARTEDRSVGKEVVSRVGCRWWPCF